MPVGYTNNGNTILGIPPTGVSNWFPRGQTLASAVAPVLPDEMYNTSTGSKQQAIICVSEAQHGLFPAGSILTLNLLAEQQTAVNYRQYTFRKSGATSTINGAEDGVEKKVLRYNLAGAIPDQVEVYVNGVKRDRGAGANEYQLFVSGIPGAPPNSIVFNTIVVGTNVQFDIIISKAPTVTNVALQFTRAIDDEGRVGIGAWEGVDTVQHITDGYALGETYSIFYCDFSEVTGLPADVKLRINPSTLIDLSSPGQRSASLVPESAAILLSRSGLFTQLDRQRSIWVKLSALTSNTDYLITKLVNGTRMLFVTEASVSPVFPILTVQRFDAARVQQRGLAGNQSAGELDNNFIIGPDT